MPVLHVDHVADARDRLAECVAPVVVVPVYNGYEDAARCFLSLLTHTPTRHGILIVDDCGADRRPIDLLDELDWEPENVVIILHRQSNGGFVAACNDAFEAAGDSDVILVNSDVVVGPEWSERLTAAAKSSSLIATASTLTNHGSILSVPNRNRPDDRLPKGMHPDDVARLVAEASLGLRPTIPTAIGHCVYVKRAVLELIGGFDTVFGTGYGEEVDFSQRAVKAGYRHVCADDVFTFHRGGSSFGEGATEQQLHNESIVNARYPWYRHWVVRASTDPYSPLALALDRARVAITGLSIAIDGMCLGSHWSGTQSVTLETIRALADVTAKSSSQLTVLHPPNILPHVEAILDGLPGVERVEVADMRHDTTTPADIVYRPYQVSTIDELRWLRERGRRVVVNQLDLIAWSNPSYFKGDHAWLSQRELTRLTLSCVDGVAFISDFVQREVADEQLIPTGTPQRVVWCGTTSAFHGIDTTARPGRMPDDDRPFLLLLGASYHHKNRAFALELLGQLRCRGWDGRLVLAGPTPPRGNSAGDEAVAALRSPTVAEYVVTLGDLTEQEKAWLYDRAALSLYPTISEGFGLVPFESAHHGVPVLSTRQGSLDEVLPTDIPTLDGFDIDRATDSAWTLLHDGEARRDQCNALVRHSESFTWERTAGELVRLFDDVLCRPRIRTAASWGEGPAPTSLHEFEKHEQRVAAATERQIQRLIQTGALKRIVVPDGSRRQSTARRSANWLRRKSSQY